MEIAGQSGVDPSNQMLQGFVLDRPAFAHVQIVLKPQEEVLADGGAMIWMDGSVQIETLMGSMGDACQRWCAGESCCQNKFSGPGKISFATKLPGDAFPFAVTPEAGWVTRGSAFICGTPNIKVNARFAGCMACLCGGTGPFLTMLSSEEGNGMFYAGGYGALTRHEVPDGKVFFIDTGLFFASNDKVEIEIGAPGNLVSCCFGGEALVCKFKGPVVVYSQNRDPYSWRHVLNPPPAKSNGSADQA